jgi:hypothetical protein
VAIPCCCSDENVVPEEPLEPELPELLVEPGSVELLLHAASAARSGRSGRTRERARVTR